MITEQQITLQYAVEWVLAELQSRGIPATVTAQVSRAEEPPEKPLSTLAPRLPRNV